METSQVSGVQNIGPANKSGRVIRQMDTLNTRVCSFLERMTFVYLPEVMKREAIVLFWYFQRVCSIISILYVCPAVGSGVDNFYCLVLGHECRIVAYACKTKE